MSQFSFLQTLRWAAMAAVLSGAVAADAASVTFSATGSTGVAGGTAFAEVVYDFDGPYPLLSLDLDVGWDPVLLTFDAANTTVSYGVVTTVLGELANLADVSQDTVAVYLLANGLDLSAFLPSAPEVDGPVTVRIAFNIAADAPAGSTLVSFAGGTANDATGDESTFDDLLPTIGIRRNGGTPLPLPGSGLLVMAAVAALAVTRRQRRAPMLGASAHAATAA